MPADEVAQRPLLKRYPRLAAQLPHIELGQFPTPVQHFPALGERIGVPELYVKADDRSGELYGGNKVRKLEFILAEARRSEVTTLITGGRAGSNHTLATTIYGRRCGMQTVALLLPQPDAPYVGRNLLLSQRHGAELHLYPDMVRLTLGGLVQVVRRLLRRRSRVRIIPAGGSSPLGCVGYVNAAFELQEQVAAGLLPEPTHIYVALGTMGTAAGLLLGLKAAGLRSKLIAVRVTEPKYAHARGLARLFRQTNRLLCRLDPSFPHCELTDGELLVRDEFFGTGYAVPTPASADAVRLAAAYHLFLDNTYTGKTFAALLGDASRARKDQPILFWNTVNSRDFSDQIANVDFRRLPAPCHRYFEPIMETRER